MIIKFESLVNGPYTVHAIQFETYWNTTGKYQWNSKHNAWVDWLYDLWNVGLINITEFRDLIMVDFDTPGDP